MATRQPSSRATSSRAGTNLGRTTRAGAALHRPRNRATGSGHRSVARTRSLLAQRTHIIRQDLAELCRTFDPEAKAEHLAPSGSPLAPHVFAVRFTAADAPFLAQIAAVSGDRNAPLAPSIVLVTTVALAMPKLRLIAEGLRHSILEALGIIRDVSIGQLSFDGIFVIDATPQAARGLLVPPVREGLLAVAHYDVPELTVADGFAALKWRYEPNSEAFRGAVQALQALREIPIQVTLVHDAD